VVLLLPACFGLSGCLFSDLTAETARLRKKSQAVTQEIETLSKEQQVIVYETADLTGRAGSAPLLASQIAQVELELARQKALLEQERNQIEANEAYLRKYPLNPVTP
jgi:hypothetical protein